MHLRQDLQLEEVCGLFLIYVPAYTEQGYPKMGTVVRLNETSAYLWNQLQPLQDFTFREMVTILLQEYDVTEELAVSDCKAILTNWADSDLLLR